MTDVQGTTECSMAEHIISIRNDGRELGDKIDTLAHQIIAGSIVGIGIETIHFEYAARKNIHDIISLQLDNIHFRLLFERHIVIDQFAERSQFFLVRQATGKQQISHFFEAETFFLDDGVGNVFHIVAPIEQFSRNWLQTAAGDTFVTYHITNLCQTYQYTGAVFITQSTLHVKLGEQFIVNPGCLFHLLGELVNQILFLHNTSFLIVTFTFRFFPQFRV